MITENEALSAASLAAVALLAEEESRNKSSRLIYTESDARYAEIIKKTVAPKELGHVLKLDIRKRGNKWVRDTVSADM
jgi:hypothetical protein